MFVQHYFLITFPEKTGVQPLLLAFESRPEADRWRREFTQVVSDCTVEAGAVHKRDFKRIPSTDLLADEVNNKPKPLTHPKASPPTVAVVPPAEERESWVDAESTLPSPCGVRAAG